jgi:hypothetical protein
MQNKRIKMDLPFEMHNLLRIMSLNMAQKLSGFGRMLLTFDIKALDEKGY